MLSVRRGRMLGGGMATAKTQLQSAILHGVLLNLDT